MWWLRFREVLESKVKQLIDVRCQAVFTQCVGNSDLHHQAEPATMVASVVGPPHISLFLASCCLLHFSGLLVWGALLIIPIHAPSVFGVLTRLSALYLPSQHWCPPASCSSVTEPKHPPDFILSMHCHTSGKNQSQILKLVQAY